MHPDTTWLIAVDPDAHSLRLAGEFDIANVAAVRAAAAATGLPGDEVRVDLSDVGFCSAALLGCLVGLRAEHAAGGGGFRLVAASPVVQRVLDITDTAALFGPRTPAPTIPTGSDLPVGHPVSITGHVRDDELCGTGMAVADHDGRSFLRVQLDA